jgi:hypothetical protein
MQVTAYILVERLQPDITLLMFEYEYSLSACNLLLTVSVVDIEMQESDIIF